MDKIKLTLEYDGAGYHGWQRQARLPTVQAALEAALLRLTGHVTMVSGAGRTDAGVHAEGQVAHFIPAAPLPTPTWVRGLNALLPSDISVRHAEPVAADFHARHSAREKVYVYQIYNSPCRSALRRQRTWHVFHPLHVRDMRVAARALLGTHDFRSFCAADHEGDDFRVDLLQIAIVKTGDAVWITFRAARFLKYMVRNLVGFLVEVGRGRRSGLEVAEVLSARDRRRAGPTAPPHGLVLAEVLYAGPSAGPSAEPSKGARPRRPAGHRNPAARTS